MSERNGGQRPRSREPRATAPLQVNAVWVAGPRTEAWDQLWRRLLAIAVEKCECADGCGCSPADADDLGQGPRSPV